MKSKSVSTLAAAFAAALSKIQGVSAVNVNLEKGEANLGFDNNVKDIPTNQLLTAIEDIGYKPSIIYE